MDRRAVDQSHRVSPRPVWRALQARRLPAHAILAKRAADADRLASEAVVTPGRRPPRLGDTGRVNLLSPARAAGMGPSRRATAGWSEVRRRFGVRTVAKGLATTLGISAFFFAYFWVLHHPLGAPVFMPVTALDRAIAFEPAALPLYVSLWLYVCLAPALLDTGRALTDYGLATLAISVVGMAVFLVWPTAVPPNGIDWSQHPATRFLKGVDLAGNACPSMHVAFAVLTGLWLVRLLRAMGSSAALHALNAVWCLGILWSTVATRQHVVLDVLAGALLGAAAAGGLLLAERRRP
jgi:membrane-associated phospholipid phosphatase